MAEERATRPDVITVDYTIKMAKRIKCVGAKKRGPRAVREIRKFVQKAMGTKDVRIDTSLNAFVWSRGIKGVPRKIRVRCSRKRNEDEEAKNKLYTVVQHVQVASFDGLQTEVVDA
eukprot:snap_masked-scaffold_4-processed-gene-7.24-mRNA-1 protein AED:0.01 eAED:0.01 QI:0/-1/0/1/-1/1/1/0/115